jgi:hypothetical protein
MVHKTPEKATIVKALLSAMRAKERVVTVKARASSEMRWSGLAIVAETFEALRGAIGKVTAQDSAGHRITPQKSESLLAEASDHGDNSQSREHTNIAQSLPDKPAMSRPAMAVMKFRPT